MRAYPAHSGVVVGESDRVVIRAAHTRGAMRSCRFVSDPPEIDSGPQPSCLGGSCP